MLLWSILKIDQGKTLRDGPIEKEIDDNSQDLPAEKGYKHILCAKKRRKKRTRQQGGLHSGNNSKNVQKA